MSPPLLPSPALSRRSFVLPAAGSTEAGTAAPMMVFAALVSVAAGTGIGTGSVTVAAGAVVVVVVSGTTGPVVVVGGCTASVTTGRVTIGALVFFVSLPLEIGRAHV